MTNPNPNPNPTPFSSSYPRLFLPFSPFSLLNFLGDFAGADEYEDVMEAIIR